MNKEISNLIGMIYEMNKKKLNEVAGFVNDIIKYNYNDENAMSHVFDRMLSIEFIGEKDLKKIIINY